MKFKMAAAAILNLLFLSILVKWSISGGIDGSSPQHLGAWPHGERGSASL